MGILVKKTQDFRKVHGLSKYWGTVKYVTICSEIVLHKSFIKWTLHFMNVSTVF